MTEAYILALSQKTLIVVLQLAGPLLVFSLAVGILVSVFQAVTQIQDMTLAFVPKIVSVIVAIVIFGPYMIRSIVAFTQAILTELPALVK
jgi:flagellar biosynthesis protein FliQ